MTLKLCLATFKSTNIAGSINIAAHMPTIIRDHVMTDL